MQLTIRIAKTEMTDRIANYIASDGKFHVENYKQTVEVTHEEDIIKHLSEMLAQELSEAQCRTRVQMLTYTYNLITTRGGINYKTKTGITFTKGSEIMFMDAENRWDDGTAKFHFIPFADVKDIHVISFQI